MTEREVTLNPELEQVISSLTGIAEDLSQLDEEATQK
jgi:hypothetical protein